MASLAESGQLLSFRRIPYVPHRHPSLSPLHRRCLSTALRRPHLQRPTTHPPILPAQAHLPQSHRTLATIDDTFSWRTLDRETDTCTVLIIGAGPSGLASAIRLRQLAATLPDPDAFRVVVLEKGSEVGAHILSGNVLQPDSLNELLPDWLSDENEGRFTGAVPASGERMRFLTEVGSFWMPTPPQMRNHGNYVLSLSQLVKYLGERAEELGVELYPGFAGAEVLYSPDGAVTGVATGDVGVDRSGRAKPSGVERGMEFRADITLFAEGCHGSLSKSVIKNFDLRRDSQHQTYALGVKEVWQVAPEKFRKGEITHSMGYPLNPSTYGGGWMYHFADNLVSIGLVVGLDYADPFLSPYGEFQRMKQHPLYRDVLEGGKCIAYGARALNEGGFQSIPKVAFPGGALVGDTAGFLNVPKIKGTHSAIRSGMLAAEAAFEAITQKEQNASPAPGVATPRSAEEGPPPVEDGRQKAGDALFLYGYEDRIRDSSIWKELKEVRNVRPSFSSLGLYGGLLYSGLEAFLFRGKTPWTLSHKHPDHAVTAPAPTDPAAAEAEGRRRKEEYAAAVDGEVGFDILTSVSRTGTDHAENQRVHLQVGGDDPATEDERWREHAVKCYKEFRGVENRFCPAGVYEYVDDDNVQTAHVDALTGEAVDGKIEKEGFRGKRFVVNSQNCIHCKTCDIKAPGQDINWAVPEGGGGPKYAVT